MSKLVKENTRGHNNSTQAISGIRNLLKGVWRYRPNPNPIVQEENLGKGGVGSGRRRINKFHGGGEGVPIGRLEMRVDALDQKKKTVEQREKHWELWN